MLVENLQYGDNKVLFPNLGMTVIANGCIAELISVNINGGGIVRYIDTFHSAYKPDSTSHVTSYLVASDSEIEEIRSRFDKKIST